MDSWKFIGLVWVRSCVLRMWSKFSRKLHFFHALICHFSSEIYRDLVSPSLTHTTHIAVWLPTVLSYRQIMLLRDGTPHIVYESSLKFSLFAALASSSPRSYYAHSIPYTPYEYMKLVVCCAVKPEWAPSPSCFVTCVPMHRACVAWCTCERMSEFKCVDVRCVVPTRTKN